MLIRRGLLRECRHFFMEIFPPVMARDVRQRKRAKQCNRIFTQAVARGFTNYAPLRNVTRDGAAWAWDLAAIK